MRQQQNNQNRRMRGRGQGGGGGNSGGGGGGGNNNNNNNRRGPNPLTRSYESNGPDVKVRGTAQNIAEKYMSLARDAQSSGDRVMAENYLQHAEHYNRIIAAAYAANPPQFQQGQNEAEEEGASEGDMRFQSNPQPQPEPQQQPFDNSAPQPVIDGVPAEVALDDQGAPRPQADADGERRPNRNRRPRGPRPPRDENVPPEGGEDTLSALPDFIVQRAPAPEPATADE
jgi:Domain of unknown function (DUF4167)